MQASRGLQLQDESDATLVARERAGDTAAYAVLVARYRVQFARYAVRMLGSREDAEEALQDAFVRAYRSIAKCDDPERFGSWLFRILVNRCRTAGTRRGRRERTFVHDEVALLTASEEHPAERVAWREEHTSRPRSSSAWADEVSRFCRTTCSSPPASSATT